MKVKKTFVCVQDDQCCNGWNQGCIICLPGKIKQYTNNAIKQGDKITITIERKGVKKK